MSYIYSQALVEEFSRANCSGIDAFAQLNGSHTHKLCLSHDKTMDVSRLSRFGMMCKPLTANLGAELLTWWLADSRVKTSQLQEKESESLENDPGCGLTWRGSLAKFDPVSRSWKTAQLSLLAESELSSVIWPRSGMTANGQCWELPMLGLRTSETDYGFSQAWPTPTVCGNYNRKGASATSGDGLATAVAMSLTMSRSEGTDARTVKAMTFPTPTVNDSKNSTLPESQRNRNGLAGTLLRSGILPGGQLSADWTEWLMGWPIGHTALKPLETDRCQPAPQQHGNC